MRRFEEQYRLNEGDDVLNRENAVHQDVDLRLDDVEQGVAAYRAGQRDDIEAILASLETTFGQLAAEMRGLLDQASGGLSADIIVETATRTFLTAARRTAILSDAQAATLSAIRDGVVSGGDTLAKLYTLIQALPTSSSVSASIAAQIAALKGSVTTAYDTLVEIEAYIVADQTAGSAVTAALGNRLRLDAAQGNGLPAQLLGRQNLGVRGAGVVTKSAAFTLDATYAGKLILCTGTFAITLAASASLGNGFAAEIRNAGTGTVTLTPNGSETVSGLASFPINRGESGALLCDGSSCQTIGFSPVVVAFSTGTNGYERWSNGKLVQWGRVSAGATDTTVTFTYAYTTLTSLTGNILEAPSSAALESVQFASVSTSGFTGRPRYYQSGGSAAAGEAWNWRAEGYV